MDTSFRGFHCDPFFLTAMTTHTMRCFLALALLLVPVYVCDYNTTKAHEALSTAAGTSVPLADRLWVNLKLRRLYSSVDKLKFCFDFDGDDEVLELLRKTLPSDAVAYNESQGAANDAICGNWTNMAPSICKTAAQFRLYLKVCDVH